jgi:hypothetical protein
MAVILTVDRPIWNWQMKRRAIIPIAPCFPMASKYI